MGRFFLIVLLIGLALASQWFLWFGKGGIYRVRALEEELATVQMTNDLMRQENERIAAEIESLESGSGAIEERARQRLGMIRKDEVLFRFVPKTDSISNP